MQIRVQNLWLFFGCGMFGLLSCTSPAEHSNPLDPQSPSYTTNGRILGRVTTLYQPYQPLSGAMVQLQPVGMIVESNAEGGFVFTEVKPDTYSLVVAATGYQSATAVTEVLPRQIRMQDFRLDGLPIVQSSRATSAHMATREATTDRLFLEIAVDVQDPDGANDVKKVQVEIPAFSFTDTLSRGSGTTRWQRVFSADELAPIDFYNLVGSPLQFVAEDFPGEQVTSGPFYLARVISEVPQATAPTNGEVITLDAPTFRWQLASIPFDHTLRVEVFRLDAGFPTFITAIGNIAAGTTSVKYPGRLATGTYYWTVKLIDDFGNSSRSKEATFQVQ